MGRDPACTQNGCSLPFARFAGAPALPVDRRFTGIPPTEISPEQNDCHQRKLRSCKPISCNASVGARPSGSSMFKCLEAKLDIEEPNQNFRQSSVCVEVATRENGGAVNPYHVMQVLEHHLMGQACSNIRKQSLTLRSPTKTSGNPQCVCVCRSCHQRKWRSCKPISCNASVGTQSNGQMFGSKA